MQRTRKPVINTNFVTFNKVKHIRWLNEYFDEKKKKLTQSFQIEQLQLEINQVERFKKLCSFQKYVLLEMIRRRIVD